MKRYSVIIDQYSDGTATVSYEGPSGRSCHTVVDADRAVLFSSYLIGWDRDGSLFQEDGDMVPEGVCNLETIVAVCR